MTAGNFGPASDPGISSSPASASVRLHGLPSNFTLVLVDGKRMPPFPFPIGVISFVDINSIPLAAVDRIEILNDGGSAVYGSDAIAGVVNVITKNEYNGADIMQYWGVSEHGDAETYHGSLVGGVSHKLWDDNSKLSIVVAFDYYGQGPILAADRPYSANPDHSVLAAKYPGIPNAFSTAGTFNSAQDGSGTQYTVFRGTTPANGFLTSANAGLPPNQNFSPNYWMDLPLTSIFHLTRSLRGRLPIYRPSKFRIKPILSAPLILKASAAFSIRRRCLVWTHSALESP
jgi:outer membrane receptor protein involved in Fe transport